MFSPEIKYRSHMCMAEQFRDIDILLIDSARSTAGRQALSSQDRLDIVAAQRLLRKLMGRQLEAAVAAEALIAVREGAADEPCPPGHMPLEAK